MGPVQREVCRICGLTKSWPSSRPPPSPADPGRARPCPRGHPQTGGNPGAIDRWGKRTFAYEVNHKREGYYVVMEFTRSPRPWPTLDRMLGLADEVVRHKVVRLPDRRLTAAAAAGRRARADERRTMATDNSVDAGRQHHPRSRAALHQHRSGRPPPSGWRSTGVGRTARPRSGKRPPRSSTWSAGARWPRTSSESLTRGRAGDGGRPTRAAQLGDPGRRQAVQGRGRGRRDRPVPALGDGRR